MSTWTRRAGFTNWSNYEVKTSFAKSLLLASQGFAGGLTSHVLRLSGYPQAENLAGFFASLQTVFASIPYDIQTKRDEAYYHTLFYLMLSASGGTAQSSVLTARGRMDMRVTCAGKVYIIEFKCNQSVEAALQQIRAQGHAEPYRGSGQKVLLMGINFSTKTRNVAAWAVEEA